MAKKMAQRKRYCTIASCINKDGTLNKETIFFQLPRTIGPARDAWINEIQKHQNIDPSSERILLCDLHFRPEQIIHGCRTKVAVGAFPTIFRESTEMQSIFEPDVQIKTEPMDLDVDMKPITPQFTYGNRKSGQPTKTDVAARSQISQIKQHPLIKIEDSVVCMGKHDQQTSQSGCVRCINITLKVTQLTAERDKFQLKCQLLQAENATLRAQIQKDTSKALRLGQIICTKRCKICSVMVAKHQLDEHLCDGLTEIACEYCADATFTSTTALREHLSSGVHTTMKFYKCSKCTLGFPMCALQKMHENHAHLSEVETDTMYKCSKCNRSSEQPLEIVRHFEESHPLQCEPPKGLSFECSICKCQLNRRSDIRKHLKQHVTVRDVKCEICGEHFTLNELQQWHICGKDDNDDTVSNEISCEYCDQSFQSVAKCVQHLETVHADERTMYRCRKCVRYFGMMQLRELHEKCYPHPTKPFQCDICSRKFAFKTQIEKHMEKAHSGNVERPYLCSECGKSVATKQSLQQHILTHTEPTIQCPDCPAKFLNRKIFKNHYQWHQNLKFKCNECNRTYSKKKSLERHMRFVHMNRTLLKKYECPHCDYKCAESDKLKSHSRTHTLEKPFECEMCHNSYRYKGDLIKHMKTHLGDDIYRCDVCGQGFQYHADLKLHTFEHYKKDKSKREADGANGLV